MKKKLEPVWVKCSVCGKPIKTIWWVKDAAISHGKCVLKATEHLRK